MNPSQSNLPQSSKAEGKRHWCGWCREFVIGVVRPMGFYGRERVCCDVCSGELGSPE